MNHTHISPSSHRDAKALERRRRKAAKLFQKGVSQAEVARCFQVSREAVRKWHDVWRKHGAPGLMAKPKPGRPSELTELKRQRVAHALLKGPHAFGYSTEVWTLSRIAKVIHSVARIRYHPGHVWRVLTSMGWSCQKPETRTRQRNEQAIKEWVRRDWPRIKKKGSELVRL